jgi:hypothetical protein
MSARKTTGINKILAAGASNKNSFAAGKKVKKYRAVIPCPGRDRDKLREESLFGLDSKKRHSSERGAPRNGGFLCFIAAGKALAAAIA